MEGVNAMEEKELRELIRNVDDIDELLQNVKNILVTLSVKADKELYETIKNTDENSKLYDEKDLDW